MIGLSKIQPHGWKEGAPIVFADNDFRIITAQPRLLIIQIRSQALRCVLIAAHAPHTGATLAEIESFWQEVNAQIPSQMGVLAPGSPRGCMKKANPLQISLPPTTFSCLAHLKNAILVPVAHGCTKTDLGSATIMLALTAPCP